MNYFKKLPLVKKIAIGVAVVGVAGASYLAIAQPSSLKTQPPFLKLVDEKLKSIITPKELIGKLTPARDIRGTWRSSLLGKGMQLYGRFTVPSAITDIYEEGDIELIIDDVTDNIATGTLRYINFCTWGKSTITIPGAERVISIPKNCYDEKFSEIQMTISSSAIDFGTITSGEITAAMRGTFTTDIMTGSITMTYPGYGEVKGTFNLTRQKTED